MVAIPVLSDASSSRPASSLAASALLFARSTVQATTSLLFQSALPPLSYPTSITRDIVPKNIHSHNDYWRQVPLFDAISYGCKSFEADIHLVEDGSEILVGHKSVSLTHGRSLKSLYLDPLEQLLELQNPSNALAVNETTELVNGVYDLAPEQSVQFLLDFKTDGPTLFDALVKYLDHYRSRNLLTTYDATTRTKTVRPVTIVCTGDCPVDLVERQNPRFIFYDAPLLDLDRVSYGAEVAPLASTSMRRMFGTFGSLDLNDERLATVRKLVDVAHAKGIKTRFWETPSWPSYKRDSTWRTLLANGVDWINADNLRAASQL
ncbi:hypothetical protein JCM10212_002837 [Sporobolomyces blumeae]